MLLLLHHDVVSIGFIHGEHYWEVKFLEPPYGTSVMVGAGTKQALLHLGNYQFRNMLGEYLL